MLMYHIKVAEEYEKSNFYDGNCIPKAIKLQCVYS